MPQYLHFQFPGLKGLFRLALAVFFNILLLSVASSVSVDSSRIFLNFCAFLRGRETRRDFLEGVVKDSAMLEVLGSSGAVTADFFFGPILLITGAGVLYCSAFLFQEEGLTCADFSRSSTLMKFSTNLQCRGIITNKRER